VAGSSAPGGDNDEAIFFEDGAECGGSLDGCFGAWVEFAMNYFWVVMNMSIY
jgi:hypothetical protein